MSPYSQIQMQYFEINKENCFGPQLEDFAFCRAQKPLVQSDGQHPEGGSVSFLIYSRTFLNLWPWAVWQLEIHWTFRGGAYSSSVYLQQCRVSHWLAQAQFWRPHQFLNRNNRSSVNLSACLLIETRTNWTRQSTVQKKRNGQHRE